MKTVFFRIIFLLVALAAGAVIFLLLTYAGSKNKGPLQDLFLSLNRNVASIEKRMTEKQDARAESLVWFNRYRFNPGLLNAPDTTLYGIYDDRSFASYENMVELENKLETHLPVVSIYTAWGSKADEIFPQIRAQAIYDLGSIPMITWEPWLDDFDPAQFAMDPQAVNKNKGGMRAIAEGKFDSYIDKWAQDAKDFGANFFLRLGHEMNDPYRYPWGPQNNRPEDFIAAWKHVVDRFRAIGVKNAIWVWSPHPAYPYVEFYPGHDYVNWIGTTVINYGTVATWSQWWSFDDIFKKFYADVSLYKKPMMVTEFGSLAVGGDRPQWFANAFQSLETKYPGVKAVVFFHVADDKTTTYKSLDWSFKDDSAVIDVIRKGIK
ncbi:MAG: glycoside hydrolase family 26 protein [Flavisolibacter sp.]